MCMCMDFRNVAIVWDDLEVGSLVVRDNGTVMGGGA